jgi:hypothetical protein
VIGKALGVIVERNLKSKRTANALCAIQKWAAHSECVVRDPEMDSAQRMRCAPA